MSPRGPVFDHSMILKTLQRKCVLEKYKWSTLSNGIMQEISSGFSAHVLDVQRPGIKISHAAHALCLMHCSSLFVNAR